MPSMNAVTTIRWALRLLVNIGIILVPGDRRWTVADNMLVRGLSHEIEITGHHRRTPLNGAEHQYDRGHCKSGEPSAGRFGGRLPGARALISNLLYAPLDSADE